MLRLRNTLNKYQHVSELLLLKQSAAAPSQNQGYYAAIRLHRQAVRTFSLFNKNAETTATPS